MSEFILAQISYTDENNNTTSFELKPDGFYIDGKNVFYSKEYEEKLWLLQEKIYPQFTDWLKENE